jgi:hypothetical protein
MMPLISMKRAGKYWMKLAVRWAGFEIQSVGQPAVMHSNNDELRQLYKRQFSKDIASANTVIKKV